MIFTYMLRRDRKLAKTIFSVLELWAFPISRDIVENDKIFRAAGSLSLHNDVDIKIGIIYKNRKIRQNSLQSGHFWSIVFMQSD